MSYTHRQIAWKIIVPALLIFLPFMLLMTIAGGQWALGVVLTIVVLGAYAVFGGINSSVDRKEVRVSFLAGWPKRVIPVRDIITHEQVRNRWWYGFGLRAIPGGMLYAVWGLDAVEIRYRDKRKGKDRMFRVGTDDPEGLTAAIAAARDAR